MRLKLCRFAAAEGRGRFVVAAATVQHCARTLMNEPDRLSVLIAGGGIGGLCTALTLHQIGVPCVVLEAVAEPKLAILDGYFNRHHFKSQMTLSLRSH